LARIESGDPIDAFVSLTIYFATGRSDLDARAHATIREFAVYARVSGTNAVVVQGYADTVGRAGPNQTLSERRANEVRRALLAEGVQANISTQGLGETSLAVSTPDNTAEQRNRRAVIVPR
jgi:outer membrane protein OmpA-like peptidoglycan-associated protein